MENRKHTRVKNNGKIRGRTLMASNLDILDLSLNGIRFHSLKRVNIDSRYNLKISKGSISVNLKGIIVRSLFTNKSLIKGKSQPVYEVAMNFDLLSDTEKSALEDIIKILNNE
ncbi:MAG: PilZ domain-containing protein [Nitrospirota bacterium]|nr:PilZ domain-containing protein [Nitrospirota bacterium]